MQNSCNMLGMSLSIKSIETSEYFVILFSILFKYISGVRMPIFWGVSILWDMLTTTIIVLIIFSMLLLSPHHHFQTPTEWFAVFLIFFMYTFAMTPIVCIWSLIFTKPSFGRAFVSIFNVIVGMLVKKAHGALEREANVSSSALFSW